MQRKRKTHLTLLFWVFLMLGGSAVWLKLTLQGDRTGHPSSKPLWQRVYNGLPVVNKLSLDVSYSDCVYKEADDTEDATLADQNACGLDNAMVSVKAAVSGVNENMDGLFLVVLASKDFKSWWQANAILLPRDMFALNASGVSAFQMSELRDSYDNAAQSASATSPDVGDVSTVVTTLLVEPLQAMFSGAGAVDMDEDRVAGALVAAKGGECVAPCYVTFDQYVLAFEALKLAYEPPHQVSTKVCTGQPGFTYLAACVTSGVTSRKLYGAKCSQPPCKGISGPPFSNCRAIATSCGATCDSEAVEPVDRDELNPKRYCHDGEIDIDEIEDFYLRTLRMDLGALIFAIMYIVGLGSLFQMYMPGVGQRQAQRPTWDKLRDAILFGQVTTLTHEWRLRQKKQKKERSEAQTRKIRQARQERREAEAAAMMERQHHDGKERDRRDSAIGPAAISRLSSFITGTKSNKRGSQADTASHSESPRDAAESLRSTSQAPGGRGSLDVPSIREGPESGEQSPGWSTSQGASRPLGLDALDAMLDTTDHDQDELLLLGNITRGTFSKMPSDLSSATEKHAASGEDGDGGPKKPAAFGRLRSTSHTRLQVHTSEDEWDDSNGGVPNGLSTVMFSISAGEGRNIVLRNLLGKISANLAMMTSLTDPEAKLQFIDAFADEGHRLGAYYLMKTVSIAFYEAMSRPVALQVAKQWLEAMNSHETASNVDVFDSPKTDVFKLLPETHQKRSELIWVRFFHNLFYVLNAFTVPVDFLFNKVLDLPLLAPETRAEAAHFLSEKLSEIDGGKGKFEERVKKLLRSEEVQSEFNAAFKITDRKAGGMVMKQCLASFSASGNPFDGAAPKTMRDLLVEKTTAKEGATPGAFSVFDPAMISTFGPVLFGMEGTFKKTLDSSVPLDAAAFMHTILKLDKADPLGCNAYYDIRAVLTLEEKHALVQATQKRQLCYDHVAKVVDERCGVHVLYLARGKPDKWQPWTKSQHRRIIKPGVWCARKPADASREAFWAARRQIALVESVDPPGAIEEGDDGHGDRHFAQESAEAYFYEDKYNPNKAQVATGAQWAEGSYRVSLSEIQLLNTHLGKAGGLNFGLEAIMMTEGVVLPSPNHPMIFGIIDARHSCDARFWLNVLPAFHELHGRNEVKFDPEICLCQIAHSYIGMEHATDKLDMRNDFLFTGMAIVRDRCYGMTSCGTGGIWSITTPEGASDFFYGRTMIEDTSTSHHKFLQGKRSIYIPPTRGTNRQLMRAVPKVSANYLEALERWDTGAVQVFVAQGVLSKWFWTCLAFLLMLHLAILAPSLTSSYDLYLVLMDPFKTRYLMNSIVYAYSTGFLCSLLFTVILLSVWSPRTLNYYLRYLILLFNTTYPFNSIASVFWIAIPPWLCLSGEFPFALNAVAAVVGSLILKFVEFMILMKMKKDSEVQGSELDETSIFRSQQMDKVTVPIKMRAVVKGLQTGWQDVRHYHDNSWWESFGAAKAQQWVQVWLLAITFFMALSLIVGPIQLLVAYLNDDGTVLDVALPVVFGMVQAVINLWITHDPLMYIMKGNAPRLSLRWLEVAVLVAMAIVTFAIINANS